MKPGRSIRTTAQALAWIRRRLSAHVIYTSVTVPPARPKWLWIATWQFDHISDGSLVRAVDALRKKVEAYRE